MTNTMSIVEKCCDRHQMKSVNHYAVAHENDMLQLTMNHFWSNQQNGKLRFSATENNTESGHRT